MNKKIIISFISLLFLTGCSSEEIMDTIGDYDNLEMIIAVIIVVGLIISIVGKLFSKSSGDHEREYNKEQEKKLQRYTEQQTNNNLNNTSNTNGFTNIESNTDVNSFENNGSFNVGSSAPSGNMEFEFYSDSSKSVDNVSTVSNNEKIMDASINKNSNMSVDNNPVTNIPLINNNQVSNENVGFNDLVNSGNIANNDLNSDNVNVDGPVIRLNNQSVVVNKEGNE